MVELVDTHALGACAFEREGSSPFIRTTTLLYEHALCEIVSGAVSDDEAGSPSGVSVFRWDEADEAVSFASFFRNVPLSYELSQKIAR